MKWLPLLALLASAALAGCDRAPTSPPHTQSHTRQQRGAGQALTAYRHLQKHSCQRTLHKVFR